MTLYEAWDIAHAYARNWSEDVALIYLASVDVDDPDAKQFSQGNQQRLGQDGQRRTWQAVFTSARLNKQLFLQITDGAVVEALEDGIHDPGVATLTRKPEMDSPEAVNRIETTRPDFSVGDGKGKGYHFIAQTNVSGKPVLAVVGSYQRSNTKSPAIIEFDQETGELRFVELNDF